MLEFRCRHVGTSKLGEVCSAKLVSYNYSNDIYYNYPMSIPILRSHGICPISAVLWHVAPLFINTRTCVLTVS